MTALAALATRAAAAPEEPWLFYRRGWDWHWRSFGQVADQVARGAAALTDAGPAVGWRSLQDPDSVALSLAVQAAARTLDPSRPQASAPDCRSRLERWRPRVLDLNAASQHPVLAAADRVSMAEIFAAAVDFDRRLPAAKGRWILCATRALAAQDFQMVIAWTLLSGAAWVLEPGAGAFCDTVLWARPSLVMATRVELARLAAAMAERKHRRHSRIRVTVDVGKQPFTPERGACARR